MKLKKEEYKVTRNANSLNWRFFYTTAFLFKINAQINGTNKPIGTNISI